MIYRVCICGLCFKSKKGYLCLNISNGKIIVIRHIVLHVSAFPFANIDPKPSMQTQSETIVIVSHNLSVTSPLSIAFPSFISYFLLIFENPSSPISNNHPNVSCDQISALVIFHEPIISLINELVILSEPLLPYLNLTPSHTNDFQLVVDLPTKTPTFPNSSNTHSMITRSKVSNIKP